MGVLAVRNLTRQIISVIPFKNVARSVAPEWELSLAFMGTTRAGHINLSLRGKTYTPNVLSYTLSKHHGEIIICFVQARTEAHSLGIPLQNYLLRLFIHGLLHLKGYRHGITMKQCEQKLLARLVRK